MTTDILIVDDEADIRELVADVLKENKYQARVAASSDEALAALADRVPSLLILDIWLQGSELDGLGILEIVKKKYPHVQVIMISGHGNIETAISAIRLGAYDYIEKPFKEDRLMMMVNKAIEYGRLLQENEELRQRGKIEAQLSGSSAAICTARQLLEKVAGSSSRVLITGAQGTGKETAARQIHNKSPRASMPFVSVCSAGLSAEQVEQELFGIESGTLMGAVEKIGLFERAHGGTLFIDEIADFPMDVQAKFLRVMQDGAFSRIGGTRRVETDVRIIASTTKDLGDLIAKGQFREDLYYRLNVVPINMPSLSERTEDIPELCQYFLAHAADVNGMQPCALHDDAVATLQTYPWPGNVRQLKNVMEWLTILHSGEAEKTITSAKLPHDVLMANPALVRPEVNPDIMSQPLREARELFEKQYLSAQIGRFGGNISKTSAFVGMERSALHRKLKMLGIGGNQPDDLRDEKLEPAG